QIGNCPPRARSCNEDAVANRRDRPAPMPRKQFLPESVLRSLRIAASPGGAAGVVGALALVAAITLILEVIKTFLDLPPIAITYLLAVLIAAIRWGFLSAMVTTIGGGFCSAFFFYKPTHTIFVEDPARRLGLLIFAIIAVGASYLAVRMRREAENV